MLFSKSLALDFCSPLACCHLSKSSVIVERLCFSHFTRHFREVCKPLSSYQTFLCRFAHVLKSFVLDVSLERCFLSACNNVATRPPQASLSAASSVPRVFISRAIHLGPQLLSTIPMLWSLTHGACACLNREKGMCSFCRLPEHRKQIEHSTSWQQERPVTSTWRASATQERLELSPCDSALSCGVQGFRVGAFESLPHRLLLG